MMGDTGAILSGGMYGNPESQYTIAQPSGVSFGGVTAGGIAKVANAGVGMYSSMQKYKYAQKQAEMDLETLRMERDYNVENFQQNMADTLASNKMSFYASGLDLTGTAIDVMTNNQRSLQQDLDVMKYNYAMREKSIKNTMKANQRNLTAGIASSVLSIF